MLYIDRCRAAFVHCRCVANAHEGLGKLVCNGEKVTGRMNREGERKYEPNCMREGLRERHVKEEMGQIACGRRHKGEIYEGRYRPDYM